MLTIRELPFSSLKMDHFCGVLEPRLDLIGSNV